MCNKILKYMLRKQSWSSIKRILEFLSSLRKVSDFYEIDVKDLFGVDSKMRIQIPLIENDFNLLNFSISKNTKKFLAG